MRFIINHFKELYSVCNSKEGTKLRGLPFFNWIILLFLLVMVFALRFETRILIAFFVWLIICIAIDMLVIYFDKKYN